MADREDLGVVLICEDEEMVMEVVSATMASKGYQVLETCCPEEAMRAVQSTPRIDVLITDYSFVGLNGVELAHKVRQAHPDCSVIVMTGYGADDLDTVSFEGGRTQILEKPFDPIELLDCV